MIRNDRLEDLISQGIRYAANKADRRKEEILKKFKVGDLKNKKTEHSISDAMDMIDFEERHSRNIFLEIK